MKLFEIFEQISNVNQNKNILKIYLNSIIKIPEVKSVQIKINKEVIIIISTDSLRQHQIYKKIVSLQNYFNFHYGFYMVLVNPAHDVFGKLVAEASKNGYNFSNDRIINQCVLTLLYGPNPVIIDRPVEKISLNLFKCIWRLRDNKWRSFSKMSWRWIVNVNKAYHGKCFIRKNNKNVKEPGFHGNTSYIIKLNTEDQIVKNVLPFMKEYEAKHPEPAPVNMRYDNDYMKNMYQAYLNG